MKKQINLISQDAKTSGKAENMQVQEVSRKIGVNGSNVVVVVVVIEEDDSF